MHCQSQQKGRGLRLMHVHTILYISCLRVEDPKEANHLDIECRTAINLVNQAPINTPDIPETPATTD